MWIFTPNAMLSLVAHRDLPDHLMVRARFAGDIAEVFPNATVTRTPAADYLYRATVTREEAAQALAQHALTMAYTNVEGAIAPRDHRRHHAMADVWQVMYDAQHAAEPYARADAMAERQAQQASAGKARRGGEGTRHQLHTGDYFAHTTARGEPRTVHVHGVQDSIGGEPRVMVEFLESKHLRTLPYSTAQDWLRNSERTL